MPSLPVTSHVEKCIANNEWLSNVFIMNKLGVVETPQVHRDKVLSQLTDCQWLDIFKSSVLDDDSKDENISLP